MKHGAGMASGLCRLYCNAAQNIYMYKGFAFESWRNSEQQMDCLCKTVIMRLAQSCQNVISVLNMR